MTERRVSEKQNTILRVREWGSERAGGFNAAPALGRNARDRWRSRGRFRPRAGLLPQPGRR